MEISTELGFFSGGVCNCGAVYAYDPTGKNLGETFMDALVYACGGDWDLALSLNRGVNYDERVINYNFRTHTVSPKRVVYGLRGESKLFFVKLKGKIIKKVNE